MSPEPPLDATGIARRHFSTVRKGYDPHEVRAFLNELSGLVGRLQREEAHEHERAQRAESRAELAERLDEHRLVELLGEETARVLEAAREAASDIRAKAEESAARMIREAQAEAHSVSEQAEREAASRRAELVGEAEALRREATDELDRRRIEGQILADDMRRAAEAERDRMLADGERSRAEAEAAAEQIRASARDQGRRLVGEAQAVRERMLGDLARRRRIAREQLERLNGARERLLAAYEVVRRTVDEATTELTVALPEARLASEAAVQRVRDEPDESVDVLEAELSVARMSGTIDEAAATVSDDELDAMLRELAEEEAARAARREAETRAALGEPGASAGPAGTEPAAGQAADATDPAPDDEQRSSPASAVGPGAPVAPEATRAADAPGSTGDAGAAAPGAPAAVPPSAGPGEPPPSTTPGSEPAPASASASAPPPAGPERPQSEAERWGVRLPPGRRGRRGARPVGVPPAAGPTVTATAGRAAGPTATATAGPAGPTATATVDTPAPASGPATAAPGPGAAPPQAEPAPPAEVEPADEGETGPYVDELFARIRAERRGEAHAVAKVAPSVAVADRAAATDADAAGQQTAGAAPGAEAGTAETATAASQAEAGAAGSADDEAAEDVVEVDPATWALRTRDEALSPLERDMGRRLKRLLTDEQNEVLDTLRRGGTVEFDDVLPEGDEHADRYAIAIGADLDAAAALGAEAGGGTSSTSCDPLAGDLGRALVQPLRRRIERSLDESEGDLEEVTERLRSLYREWKGQRIGAAVRHYATAAYSVGVADSLPAGTPQRWIVDPSSCAACPDCDDNALAGEVTVGDAFPTGDTRAPAHPDCRCLVVAAATLHLA